MLPFIVLLCVSFFLLPNFVFPRGKHKHTHTHTHLVSVFHLLLGFFGCNDHTWWWPLFVCSVCQTDFKTFWNYFSHYMIILLVATTMAAIPIPRRTIETKRKKAHTKKAVCSKESESYMRILSSYEFHWIVCQNISVDSHICWAHPTEYSRGKPKFNKIKTNTLWKYNKQWTWIFECCEAKCSWCCCFLLYCFVLFFGFLLVNTTNKRWIGRMLLYVCFSKACCVNEWEIC